MVRAASEDDGDTQHLASLIDALTGRLPFRRETVEQTLSIHLEANAPFFDSKLEGCCYEGPVPEKVVSIFGVEIVIVRLNVVLSDPQRNASLYLQLSPVCVTPQSLERHYGTSPRVGLILLNPPRQKLAFKEPWGTTTFVYDGNDCVDTVVLTPAAYAEVIKHGK